MWDPRDAQRPRDLGGLNINTTTAQLTLDTHKALKALETALLCCVTSCW
jgi:hypothetical protein